MDLQKEKVSTYKLVKCCAHNSIIKADMVSKSSSNTFLHLFHLQNGNNGAYCIAYEEDEMG